MLGGGEEGKGGGVTDTGEAMCYGECCEVCKPCDFRPVPLGLIIHYMFMRKIKNNFKNTKGTGVSGANSM